MTSPLDLKIRRAVVAYVVAKESRPRDFGLHQRLYGELRLLGREAMKLVDVEEIAGIGPSAPDADPVRSQAPRLPYRDN